MKLFFLCLIICVAQTATVVHSKRDEAANAVQKLVETADNRFRRQSTERKRITTETNALVNKLFKELK